MDDATQMLGQDVIRFIKKKNISANYCQEQSRIMKKHSKKTSNYRPLKSFKYAYDYPQYYQSRPFLEKTAAKRLANFHSYYVKNKSHHMRSSSSSNSGYAKWRAQYVGRRPKRYEAAHTVRRNKPNDPRQQSQTTDESKNNPNSSNESDQKEIKICSVSEQSHRDQSSNKDGSRLPPTENNRLPSLFEDIFSKKSFQPSLLKDHTLFTQYMICKYIDDLPNSWNQDDQTAMATGENNTGQESIETKSVSKRPLDDQDDQATSNIVLNNAKSRKQSSTQNSEIAVTSISVKNSSDFLGDKTMLDYFLNKNDTSNLNPNDEQVMFKKANSYSSRSHSRIVLIDENDNDEEEETVKMVISQNSEEIPIEYVQPRSIEPPSTPSIQPSSSKCELKSMAGSDKCVRLTKENLAKHTREQDELYLMGILKKVHKTFAKKISEHPQNICAQAPNVFSCNEYEPKMKKLKKYNQILREKNPNSSISSGELAAQYDIELNIGPYSGTINEIDFDNPQNYHESFNKKLQADLCLSKQIKPSDKLRDDNRLSQDSRMDTRSQKATKCSGKDRESSTNSSNSQPSLGSNKNDDLIGFWRKCIRQGSTIVKRIKECDNIIKIINSKKQKKSIIEATIENETNGANMETSKDPNGANMNKIHLDALNQTLNDQTNILKLTKQLKKRLYITASLLGINTDIGFDDISIDSEKSEIIESLIKKIISELLNSNNSANLAQFYNRISGQSPKHFDTNSIELLTSIYEDLKHKFLSQFDRFSKDSKMIFNSSSSAALHSTTSNNEDDGSSLNPALNNPMHTNASKQSKSSPNDFEMSSHYTNEFDDSSTYLYDSPTSSLESTDMQSVSNGKKVARTLNGRPKSSRSKLSCELFPKPRSNHDENGFDDGLICKIMQNYIDLFKTKEPNGNPAEQTKCCAKSVKTSTDESSKIIIENSSNDTFSYESKSNKNKTPESKIEEDECVKNLTLNIYNDCFKCLSNVSTLDKQKNLMNETESD